ncbi:MAG: hypothetical protein ACFFG0_23655 [Candidatus Thorarchaeota archaeon]
MSFELNRAAEVRAEAAAQSIRDLLGLGEDEVPAKIAIFFTTDLGEHVKWGEAGSKLINFSSIRGFEALTDLGRVKGHARQISLNTIGGNKIWRVNGRIHLNENPTNPGPVNAMVRLQIDMLCKLGVKIIILTSAVGSTTSAVRVGQIGVIQRFLSYGSSFTGCSGEFPMIEDALCPDLQNIALEEAEKFQAVPVTHFFWPGPHVESPEQKRHMASMGAHIVGMSNQPEADAAARQGAKVLGLGYVTNGYEHDHDQVIEAADEHGPAWMAHLVRIVAYLDTSYYIEAHRL